MRRLKAIEILVCTCILVFTNTIYLLFGLIKLNELNSTSSDFANIFTTLGTIVSFFFLLLCIGITYLQYKLQHFGALEDEELYTPVRRNEEENEETVLTNM